MDKKILVLSFLMILIGSLIWKPSLYPQKRDRKAEKTLDKAMQKMAKVKKGFCFKGETMITITREAEGRMAPPQEQIETIEDGLYDVSDNSCYYKTEKGGEIYQKGKDLVRKDSETGQWTKASAEDLLPWEQLKTFIPHFKDLSSAEKEAIQITYRGKEKGKLCRVIEANLDLGEVKKLMEEDQLFMLPKPPEEQILELSKASYKMWIGGNNSRLYQVLFTLELTGEITRTVPTQGGGSREVNIKTTAEVSQEIYFYNYDYKIKLVMPFEVRKLLEPAAAQEPPEPEPTEPSDEPVEPAPTETPPDTPEPEPAPGPTLSEEEKLIVKSINQSLTQMTEIKGYHFEIKIVQEKEIPDRDPGQTKRTIKGFHRNPDITYVKYQDEGQESEICKKGDQIIRRDPQSGLSISIPYLDSDFSPLDHLNYFKGELAGIKLKGIERLGDKNYKIIEASVNPEALEKFVIDQRLFHLVQRGYEPQYQGHYEIWIDEKDLLISLLRLSTEASSHTDLPAGQAGRKQPSKMTMRKIWETVFFSYNTNLEIPPAVEKALGE